MRIIVMLNSTQSAGRPVTAILSTTRCADEGLAMYEVAVLGYPTSLQLKALEDSLRAAMEKLKLTFGEDLRFTVAPSRVDPDQRCVAVAIFYGGELGAGFLVDHVLNQAKIAVIPVASSKESIARHIPAALQHLNCLIYDGANRLVSVVLESLGLLQRQRRVLLSYRRVEAREAALQLVNGLTARGFEVFLDPNGVPPAEDFAAELWHQLCDADVMVMLETPGYFSSRWTSEEFGRVLAKSIGVLRVQWPDATPSRETTTSSLVGLAPSDIKDETGALTLAAIDRVCSRLEQFRGLCYLVRRLSVMSQLRAAVERVDGQVIGLGPHHIIHVALPGDRSLDILPVLGVPDSSTLQVAIERAEGRASAVLYDHVGVPPPWNAHLDWLEECHPGSRWIRASHAVTDLAQWRAW